MPGTVGRAVGLVHLLLDALIQPKVLSFMAVPRFTHAQ